jgi:hypothetical protein
MRKKFLYLYYDILCILWFSQKTDLWNANKLYSTLKSWDSSASTAAGYGLDGQGFIPNGGQDFSLLHNVQTITEAHPASYPVGTRISSTGVKRRSMKLTTHLHVLLRSRMMELYLHSLTRLRGVVLN